MHVGIFNLNHLNDSLKEVINLTFDFFNKNKAAIQNLSKFRNSFSKEVDIKVFDILSEYLLKAEKAAPKASHLMLLGLSGKEIQFDDPTPLSSKNLFSLLENFFLPEEVNSISTAISLAGLQGKLVLKKGTSQKVIIELTKGLEFEISPAFQLKNIELKDAKIIPIDGYIENVSEIHHLLESASEKKETILLCVRGMSDDVLHTLKINFDRKTVLCIPFIVPFDIDGANLLVDLAVTSNCDVISTLKGQLINSVNLQSYDFVDSVVVESDRIFIKNSKNHGAIDKHIANLQLKIALNVNDATNEALSKRIKRLGNNQVNIIIPDNSDFSKVSFYYDRCIRAFKSSQDHGVVAIEGKLYPYASIKAAQFYQYQFDKFIKDIGCIIY